MTVLNCPIPGCGFATDDVDVVGAAAILNAHTYTHMAVAQQAAPPVRGPKLDRPKLQLNCTNEDWNAFQRRWETYRTGSGIRDDNAAGQLLECTTEQLGNILLRAEPAFTTKPIAEALQVLKSVAVVPVALGVLRSELSIMRQYPDEPFRTFAARVQGKAEVCEFTVTFNVNCGTCNNAVTGEVYYTDEVIRDVLLNGIADSDIRREALGSEDIQVKSIAQVIAFIESREIARNANSHSPSLSALSSYRRSNCQSSGRSQSPSRADHSKPAKCPDCGNTLDVYTKKSRGWNRNPHKKCESCWKKSRTSDHAETSAIASDSDPVGQISLVRSIPLGHHIFNKGEWRRSDIKEHPRIQLELSSKNVSTSVTAVADSGAQSNLWSLNQFLDAGFTKADLSPVSLSLSAANKSPIKIEGAFFAKLTGRSPAGKTVSCQSMIYVSKDVKSLYLSYDTMLDLGILNRNFPQIGMFQDKEQSSIQNSDISMSSGMICGATKDDGGICDCPKRTPVPDKPDEFPFPCTPENNSKMKAWLLDRYKSSTFNRCPHQLLPSMTGPPVEIHIKDDVKPIACHKATPIPLHWQKTVESDLYRDEALGVIERVPIGEPVDWCHRMVVTRKPDGNPRRTVDLSPLNKFCKRETHNSEAPFHVARRVPRNTWKTVTDAWNGFHSVPLRHLTTFITPIGRWRYKRLPQGFLSSGDGYNRRLDAILAEFERRERVVDDTLFHDESLQEHWKRTIDILSLLGEAPICPESS